jgi:hypothetical protein
MVRVLIIFLVIQYGTYVEEKFDTLQQENQLLRFALLQALEMEHFSLRIKDRTDIEEFRFQEIGKQLEKLHSNK